jgi:hypothetical protein
MKASVKLLLGIVSLLLSAYFFIMRSDVFPRIFKRHIPDIGPLLLPVILLILAIIFLRSARTHKKTTGT